MLTYSYLLTILIVASSSGLQFSNYENYSLPDLIFLDDYHKCLTKKNGLYCFGKFHIHSKGSVEKKYEFISEYSKLPYNYDRTYFHRGYCVSARCPPHTNTTERFERCVQGSENGLNTTLDTLYFCRTQKKTVEPDLWMLSYLFMVLFIALMNIIGTFLDVRRSRIKSKFWTAWSIRSNWKELMTPFGTDSETMSLAPIQGVRLILTAVVIFIHVLLLTGAAYLYNPEFIEKLIINPINVWPCQAVSVIQVTFALSTFFSAYHLLNTSKKQPLTLSIMPFQISKRFFRIAPVHLLFVGFAATIWPSMDDGPMWSTKIAQYCETCRNKFWTHLLHVNNLVRPLDHCLHQTWYLAADVQCQIFASMTTILLFQHKLPKLKVLLAMLSVSTLYNAVLAYINDWKPFYLMVSAKSVVALGSDLETYMPHYYLSPMGNLPSCIIGLIFAHAYFNYRQNNNKLKDHKILAQAFRWSFPMLILWTSAGALIPLIESPLVLAILTAIERPMFSGLFISWLFGFLVFDGQSAVKKFLCWRGWLPLGRLSLPVLMLHWIVILSSYSFQSRPLFASYPTVMLTFVTTWVISYILAIPLTLMVELPVKNTYNYLICKTQKSYGASKESKKVLDKHE